MNKLKYLNLGCGHRFHKDWVNLDFVSTGEGVIAHNLLQGIPFEDESFEVVYHAHVLEHFSKKDALTFIQECYRVLKIRGIIRIAVPDLEQITREYIKTLELSLEGDVKAPADYDWILLEMYDQTVRNQSGGEMAQYIFQDQIPNEDYVFARIGEEGRNLRKSYLENQKLNTPQSVPLKGSGVRNLLARSKNKIKSFLINLLIPNYSSERKFLEIGKFRLSGEIHQWMYDRYSLGRLLREQGFQEVSVKTAFESDITNWNDFQLESKEGIVFKPDSLFIEAKKI